MTEVVIYILIRNVVYRSKIHSEELYRAREFMERKVRENIRKNGEGRNRKRRTCESNNMQRKLIKLL